MKERQRPIMVMAGGTGGHVFPALAVAEELRSQGHSVVWMGTRKGVESRLVPAAGYPIEWLQVAGLRGKSRLTMALAPFKLIAACWQAAGILRRNRPRAVLGMGGFASGPGGLMAWLMRIPLVIHEQNAIMGLTNRILRSVSSRVFFAFPQRFPLRAKESVIGNPVRVEIAALEEPKQRLADRDNQTVRLLVIGGSLGARTLNTIVPEALAKLDSHLRLEVRHQCGERHLEDCAQHYQKLGVTAEVQPFIDNMQQAYQWCDLVLCRAGAMTVSELSAVGVAAILVPFPYAVDDHQYHNAMFLQRAQAAVVFRESELTASVLAQCLQELVTDRSQLMKMSVKARALAKVDAAQQVAETLLQEALV